jgi:hypothetical protein
VFRHHSGGGYHQDGRVDGYGPRYGQRPQAHSFGYSRGDGTRGSDAYR